MIRRVFEMDGRRPWVQTKISAWLLVMAGLCMTTGCVGHRVYNSEPEQYLQSIALDESAPATADLAIIEFDDHGVLWSMDQLESAVDLIQRRNSEAKQGVLVVVFIHGWKNNADADDAGGALARFKRTITAQAAAQSDVVSADHVVGVFLGWRGATSKIPLLEQLTFWDRRRTAERLASLNMRETLFRIMNATKQRPGSKCFIVGHSMGGMVIGSTMAPSLTTLLLANQDRGTLLPADLVLLQNPALDGLASWQFIDFLKRSGARVQLRTLDGERIEAKGPIIASITSEADNATGAAYPLGRSVGSLFTAFRTDHAKGDPSQRHLATHAEGHIDHLVSHRAYLENGEVVIDRVPNAFNNTPFWIIRVSRDISRDHNDVNNPVYGRLVAKLIELNDVYRTDLETWMIARPADQR